ncbi:MAG: ABC transporter permease [Labedaea sp.]
MVWLTWRQHRPQLLVTTAILLILGTVLLVHGLRADALAGPALGDQFSGLFDAISWLPLAPALIGLFWGTPVLAKEFERGTHRLAWTQSVSTRRWLAVKLSMLSAMVVLAGLAFAAMIGRWLDAFAGTPRADRFSNSGIFVLTGVVPAAWWLFAFMTGVAAGAVFRRTLPAIAVTLAIVLTAILGMFFYNVRAYYAPAEHTIVDNIATSEQVPAGSLIQGFEPVDANGQLLPRGRSAGCPPNATNCPVETVTRQLVSYQPPTRYWQFQWTETAMLLAATLLLGAIAVERTIRSRS